MSTATEYELAARVRFGDAAHWECSMLFFFASRLRILRIQTQSGQGAENIRKATSFRGGEGGKRDRDETWRVRNDFVEGGVSLVWIRTVRIAVRL